MLKSLVTFQRNVALVPNSGIQFMDIGLPDQKIAGTTRHFAVEPEESKGGSGVEAYRLIPLEINRESGLLVDSLNEDQTFDPMDPRVLTINGRKAVEMFLGRWVPVPFLKSRGLDGRGVASYEEGPINWARMCVIELGQPDDRGNRYRIVFAFDTAIEPRNPSRQYLAPSQEDTASEGQFHLVSEHRENSWFLKLPWVKEWLDELLTGSLKRRQTAQHCEQWARYLTLLGLVTAAEAIPSIRFNDVLSQNATYTAIPVDLVLDLGNNRTCGILIEEMQTDYLSLDASYPLELRDLGKPEFVYDEPFQSRIEFVRTEFGNQALARRAGRSNAFRWPSVVRIGPEAVRLNGESAGSEGMTGLSGAKRYLWDGRANRQPWRFNGIADDQETRDPPVAGRILTFLTERGDVVSLSKGQDNAPAFRPLFSRSSLYTFFLTEILAQAMVQINAPATRNRRKDPDAPRHLRRIILTIPTATPLIEREVMRKRALGAVNLVWELMNWPIDPEECRRQRLPIPPKIEISWDEATSTQMVYLYSAITQRIREGADEFFNLLGRQRGGVPSIRIASLDIGGGTTDLMIVTYSTGIGQAMNTRQEFREGFRIAGDDIVEAIVAHHVLGPIREHMRNCGVEFPEALINNLFSGDLANQPESFRSNRRLLVNHILVLAAYNLLSACEAASQRGTTVVDPLPLQAILPAPEHSLHRAVRFLEDAAAKDGAVDFRLADIKLPCDFAAIANTVRLVIGAIIADLCEVVHVYDCDVLLLTGRPSRLPIIQEMVLSRLPVPVHRIIPMHRFKVGNWYPFRDRSGQIGDPKTTVAVGALLCSLASERRITGISMSSEGLAHRSTARYIGLVENTGRIKTHNVLIDTEAASRRGTDSIEASLLMDQPVLLGYRQLPLQRWQATPLYFLSFVDSPDERRIREAYKKPWRVYLRQDFHQDLPGSKPELEPEILNIDRVETTGHDIQEVPARHAVDIRLQTMYMEAGYWLDTGHIQYLELKSPML